MSTVRDVVDAALAESLGETQTIDQTTFLAAPLTDTGLTVEVTSANGFSRGMVQVEDELMVVSEVDREGDTLTLEYLSARGVRATERVAHPAGALVTMSPSIPRFRAVRAVEESITSSPGLFRVAEHGFPMVASRVGYPLPNEAKDVLQVTWIPSGPTRDWLPMRRWTFDKFHHDLVIGEAVEPGREIRVHYSADPVMPDLDEDFTLSGLPNTCQDVIRYGAAWRMTSFIEPMNLLARSAEAEAMDRTKTSQTRLRVAQYLYGVYQQRLQEEVQTLNVKYPIRVHSVGRW